HPLHLHSFPTRRSSDLSFVESAKDPKVILLVEDLLGSRRLVQPLNAQTRLSRGGISDERIAWLPALATVCREHDATAGHRDRRRSEEHTSELQSRFDLV